MLRLHVIRRTWIDWKIATNTLPKKSIRNWISQIQKLADVHVNKILVGNKCDMLDDKVVSTEEGQKLASEFGIPFWECSAKTDINVDSSFQG
jgi:Ras-related protein Rab-8A